MKTKRECIIELYLLEYQPQEFSNTLNSPPSTVYDAIHRYEVTSSLDDRPRSGRPSTFNTQDLRDKVRLRMNMKSREYLTKLAKSVQVSRETVRQLVKNKLNRRPYKLQKSHVLTDNINEVRLAECKNFLKHNASKK